MQFNIEIIWEGIHRNKRYFLCSYYVSFRSQIRKTNKLEWRASSEECTSYFPLFSIFVTVVLISNMSFPKFITNILFKCLDFEVVL